MFLTCSNALPAANIAESFDESCDIIRSASSSGTSVMVATPHFNNPFQGRSGVTKKTVLENYSELKRVVAEEVPSVTLFLGSELLVRDNIHEVLGNNDFFSINGSRYLLAEFAFDEKISNVKRYIEISCYLYYKGGELYGSENKFKAFTYSAIFV